MTVKSSSWVLFLLQVLSAVAMDLALTSAGAEAPGDIIIGGLFAVHEAVEKNATDLYPHVDKCVSFKTSGLVNVLAMINAVKRANKSPAMAATGVSLGYRIYDTCGDVSTALRATADLTQQGACLTGIDVSANASSAPATHLQTATAVVGATFSETTIAVAQQLTLQMIPQISYSATAVVLSDKSRFPAFMRTVPDDRHLAEGMVRLLGDNAWTWVGVLTSDGEYGRSAQGQFATAASRGGICVSFTEWLPELVAGPRAVAEATRQAAAIILGNPRVKVIVSFLGPTNMRALLKEIRAQAAAVAIATTARVWVAGDSWSSSSWVLGNGVALGDVGKVVGFRFKRGSLTSFIDYLAALPSTGAAAPANNIALLQEFYAAQGNASQAHALLATHVHAHLVWSVEMAVNAIAQAVASLCRSRDCKTGGALQPWELLGALRTGKFDLEGQRYSFDASGDINQGYDVTLWNSEGGRVQVNDVVAEYYTSNNSLCFTNHSRLMQFLDLKNITSRCSDRCEPGQFKQIVEGQHTCCYECANCTENYYSNSTDMDQCYLCDTQREWSPQGSSHCIPKTLVYFSWDDGFAAVLLGLAAVGLLLVLFLSCLFLHQRNTPMVRAAGGALCQLILLSLLGSFTSVVLFVGRPSRIQCACRQVLFGLSFTLCVSCILAKSVKVLLAFQFRPGLQQVLRRFYRPYAIVCGCVAVQAGVCSAWLVLDGPAYRVLVYPTTLLAQCHESSYVAFGVMLGYIAALALVCFACAFKGRKLPHKYNDARFTTFSMLLYLVSWSIFVPVFVTTTGRYVPAVEMVVILVSNYGVLSCHFLPKAYTILFRKEKNTASAFKKSVYEYTLKRSASAAVPANVSHERSITQLSVASLQTTVEEKDPAELPGYRKAEACADGTRERTPLERPPCHRRRTSSI